MEATAIILAGGKSSRMGRNKALLEIGGMSVIERIVTELSKVTNEIILVTNSPAEYQFLNLPMAEDEWKGMGPLAGIHAGLHFSKTEKNLVVACDMPFISPALASFILGGLSDIYDAVVPEIAGKLHPLFAAYHKRILPVISESLQNKQLRIRSIFEQIPVKIVNEGDFLHVQDMRNESSFYNMNEPHDFKRAQLIMQELKDLDRM
ncbi:molybdenum cofactor guanylyltransferase [Cytobacillus sp. Hz8]|uniref:molybdenum cofactor guanylyltransferase n=1 Tax=Cytobacillus sp. Hz8 TaxID=3347168 RepID=UPI0035DDFCB7